MKSTIASAKADIPLYGGKLFIHVTKDMENTLDEVGFKEELNCDACCLHDVGATSARYDLIFKKGAITHGVIAHECFHLTHRIMNGINKAYDITNDEPEAYLIHFLVDKVYEFLKDNKIKVA